MAQRYKVVVGRASYSEFHLYIDRSAKNDMYEDWQYVKTIQAANMEDAVDSAKNWIEWINQPAVEFEV